MLPAHLKLHRMHDYMECTTSCNDAVTAVVVSARREIEACIIRSSCRWDQYETKRVVADEERSKVDLAKIGTGDETVSW